MALMLHQDGPLEQLEQLDHLDRLDHLEGHPRSSGPLPDYYHHHHLSSQHHNHHHHHHHPFPARPPRPGGVPSPALAGALHVISRQHQAAAAHALQPVSAFSSDAASGLGLFDLADVSSTLSDFSSFFMPGCCVLLLACSCPPCHLPPPYPRALPLLVLPSCVLSLSSSWLFPRPLFPPPRFI